MEEEPQPSAPPTPPTEGEASAAPDAPPAEKPAPEAEERLHLAQAADFVGLTKGRLNQLRRSGEIPAQRVGWRGWSFRTADLMAYVERAAGVPPEAGTTDAPPAKPSPGRTGLDDIARALGELGPPKEKDSVHEAVDEAPIVRMVNAVLVTGIEQRASDIHIEPDRNNLRVRIRVDGVMLQLMAIPKHIQTAFAARLKVMADVPLYQRASMHHGYIPIRLGEQDLNIRVSVVPSLYGESLVIHIIRQLSPGESQPQGLSPEAWGVLEQLLFFTRGLLLVAGPPGSGRTTTAALMLRRMNSVQRTIYTWEELPEYVIGGIMHSYASRTKGVTITEAVPALLRHGPDILFLGDITDAASAKAAVDAGRSGTLVIATIAARDSVDALLRLVAYGISPEEVGRVVTGVVAQHLLPKICTECGGEGCDECRKTGKRGRIGVFEMIAMDKDIRETMAKMPPRDWGVSEYGASWVQTKLLGDAREKAERGIVSKDAVARLAAILPR